MLDGIPFLGPSWMAVREAGLVGVQFSNLFIFIVGVLLSDGHAIDDSRRDRLLAVFAPSVLLFGQGVEFRQCEPCADDRVANLAGLVLDVRGGDYRAVVQ